MLLRAASPLGKERRGPTFSSASRREKAMQGEEIAGKDVGGGVGKEESSQFLFFFLAWRIGAVKTCRSMVARCGVSTPL